MIRIAEWQFNANVTGWAIRTVGDPDGDLSWDAEGHLVIEWYEFGLYHGIQATITDPDLTSGDRVRIRMRCTSQNGASIAAIKLVQGSGGSPAETTIGSSITITDEWTDVEVEAALTTSPNDNFLLRIEFGTSGTQDLIVDYIEVDHVAIPPEVITSHVPSLSSTNPDTAAHGVTSLNAAPPAVAATGVSAFSATTPSLKTP